MTFKYANSIVTIPDVSVLKTGDLIERTVPETNWFKRLFHLLLFLPTPMKREMYIVGKVTEGLIEIIPYEESID